MISKQINSDKDRIGDSKDFEHLYTLYYPAVRDFIKKYVYSTVIAEDLTQEVFIKLWDSRVQSKQVTYLKTYIFTIAKNHTLNSLKMMARSKASLNNMMANYTAQENVVEDDLQFQEYKQIVDTVLKSIPLRSRTIFELCREEGRSYAEVAENQGISKSAVKNHMVATMKLLKNAIEHRLGIPLSVFLFLLFK